MTGVTWWKAAMAAAVMASVGAGTSPAATLVALQDGKAIVRIDTSQWKVVGTTPLAQGATLVGIDVRPADGQLYGVTPDGAIVTIDPATGAWRKVSQLSERLPAGTPIAVDFNPVADRLRIVAASGLSLRVNVEDGKAIVDGSLKYAAADAAAMRAPQVTAAAYSNSMAGARETTLYDIDTAAWTLLKQVPPNEGVLTTIGALGVPMKGAVAFDIATGSSGNTAWLVNDGQVYTVDLSSGAARRMGAIGGLTAGSIVDIALLP